MVERACRVYCRPKDGIEWCFAPVVGPVHIGGSHRWYEDGSRCSSTQRQGGTGVLRSHRFYSTFLLSKKYISYPLAIPTLIAMTPPEHQIRVFDENVEAIDYSWDADLVGITVRTMFAERAYAISKACRKRGAKTVLAGIHPSMCTAEAAQHCDSVVVGEAEPCGIPFCETPSRAS
jgi:hypothetical protein